MKSIEEMNLDELIWFAEEQFRVFERPAAMVSKRMLEILKENREKINEN